MSKTWKHAAGILFATTISIWSSGNNVSNAAISDWSEFSPKNTEDLLKIQNQLEKLIPAARDATVAIIGRGSGSGVIVSEDGIILTAAHMIGRPNERVEVILSDGKRVQARMLGGMRFSDAGMAKTVSSGPWPFVPLAESDAAVGDWCFAVGHPGGYNENRGVAVRLGRVISMSRRRSTIRTDCKIISGDSGGPLLNLNGELIGIHSRISEDMDDNYHVPIKLYRDDWDKLFAGIVFPIRPGPVGGFLGVRTGDHSQGRVIQEIIEESVAEKADLKPGDIVLQVDGFSIRDWNQFGWAIGSHRPGEKVELQIKRDEETFEVEIALGSQPRS